MEYLVRWVVLFVGSSSGGGCLVDVIWMLLDLVLNAMIDIVVIVVSLFLMMSSFRCVSVVERL